LPASEGCSAQREPKAFFETGTWDMRGFIGLLVVSLVGSTIAIIALLAVFEHIMSK
jgi:hypothetical protein